MERNYIILTVILIISIIGVTSYFFVPPLKYWTSNPTTFEECKEAGGKIWHTKQYFCIFRGKTYEEQALKIGTAVNTDIQTPHPYPNSEISTKLVWSHTLNQPNSKFLRLHFERFEVKGIIDTPVVYETIDLGPCVVSAPQATPPKEGQVSAPAASPNECGNQTIKKIFTPQEIFDKRYVTGDFVAIKDKDEKVLDILVRESLPAFNGSPAGFLRQDVWGQTYFDVDTLIIELYADESDNGFGLYIDKYVRGFTEEERELVNREMMDQYLQDCEKQGIPPERCPIPE